MNKKMDRMDVFDRGAIIIFISAEDHSRGEVLNAN